MLRRLLALTLVSAMLVGLPSGATAVAQDGSADDQDTATEPLYYGDSELIETLRSYGLLDEWIAASPVSPQASLLLVTGNGAYQAQRQSFLDSLDAWARRTEALRDDLARLDAAQGDADQIRAVIVQVRDALVLDDRLAGDSNTLLQIDDALGKLAAIQIWEQETGLQLEDPLVLAETQLRDLQRRAESEVTALNGPAPAVTSSGIEAFVGFDALQSELNAVDQLLKSRRDRVQPAREESERLVSFALAQIPNLHATRMLGSTDVGGLSVVTVDAYIRAAQGSSCAVDWALLAAIGRIESNHGQIGGATVFRSGQVSTTILGPLLDGGVSEPDRREARRRDQDLQAVVTAAVDATSRALQLWASAGLGDFGDRFAEASDYADQLHTGEVFGAQGNGFAIVVDTDAGRLDGNDQWDRAVGPMQFLPETWSRWATDGNGDGVADPNNLYDAAAAAARFLCDLSVTRGASPSTFLLGYNASSSYVRSVLAAAQDLRSVALPETQT